MALKWLMGLYWNIVPSFVEKLPLKSLETSIYTSFLASKIAGVLPLVKYNIKQADVVCTVVLVCLHTVESYYIIKQQIQ